MTRGAWSCVPRAAWAQRPSQSRAPTVEPAGSVFQIHAEPRDAPGGHNIHPRLAHGLKASSPKCRGRLNSVTGSRSEPASDHSGSFAPSGACLQADPAPAPISTCLASLSRSWAGALAPSPGGGPLGRPVPVSSSRAHDVSWATSPSESPRTVPARGFPSQSLLPLPAPLLPLTHFTAKGRKLGGPRARPSPHSSKEGCLDLNRGRLRPA